MSKLEKEFERLKSRPKDFTYDEAKNVLNIFGFIESILKPYQIKIIIDILKEKKYFYE